jgi:acid-sensing ion channel, other
MKKRELKTLNDSICGHVLIVFIFSVDLLTAAAQVCDLDIFNYIDPENRTNCDKCRSHLWMLRGHIDRFARYCRFLDGRECSELFKEVITEEGMCSTFNVQKYHRGEADNHFRKYQTWTNLEQGYTSNNYSMYDYYPKKGSKYSMHISFMQILGHDNSICHGPVQGFKVFLHLPNEAPQTSKNYYLVPMMQTVHLLIVPRMIITMEELRDYSAQIRQCYFNSERYLRFFKYYTQNNCEIECVAKLTLESCGCLKFYMPSED